MPKKKAKPSTTPKAKRKKWGVSDKEKDEHFERDIYIEDDLMNTILKEVPKMKMITHSLISLKYNIRISLVKKILNDLLGEKKIKPYILSNRLKVYVPA
ncbi:MAG: hypothetical protein HWN66_09950 [Candidatus Helarchaeota archaeon]|nr:hypothetical protein [Candidatus Helarchaeota archaeon]